MVEYGRGLIGYILSIISLVHGSITLIICCIVLIGIAYHSYHYHRGMKRTEKVTLVLSANIYFFILIFMAILIVNNTQTLIGDMYGVDFSTNRSLCIFKGYSIISICCATYNSFVIQALYRLFRIVYHNYQRVQLYWFYLIITPIQLAAGFLFMSPVVIWHGITYVPNDYYCMIQFTNFRVTMWSSFNAYGIPIVCLLMIYTRITLFIRNHSAHQTSIVKQRQNRDLVAVQRIIVSVGILLTLGLPTVIFLFILLITNFEHPLLNRTMWLDLEVSMVILSVGMVWMTPQLKNIFLRRMLLNKVIPVGTLFHPQPNTTIA
ncbi:unnamed protein product [Adineta ricciae]|uniref:G-protein coupled receptors family 1 profile domain-containing protein n=1 Tax=Adineta ricciae TaxID=249248 RepID=A0A813PYN3_ADIRI|nr:unnamed protein product [Adineta ricciae]CAF1254470.1 unnamed protein product [Adineta ricciae]